MNGSKALREKYLDHSGANEMDVTSLPAMPMTNDSQFCRPAEKRSCASDPIQKAVHENPSNSKLMFHAKKTLAYRSDAPFPLYFNSSFAQVAVRAKIIALIWSCCCSKRFSLSTYYNAIAYLDMLFSKTTVPPERADIVAVTVTVLAAKLNERKRLLPTSNVILSFLPSGSTKDEFIATELWIVTNLDFALHVYTAFHHLQRMMQQHTVTATDLAEAGHPTDLIEKVTLSLKQLAFFFLELSIKDYDFNQFAPATIALGCLMCSRACVELRPYGGLVAQLMEEQGAEVGRFIERCFRTLASNNLNFFTRFRKPIRSLLAEVEKRAMEASEGKGNRSLLSDFQAHNVSGFGDHQSQSPRASPDISSRLEAQASMMKSDEQDAMQIEAPEWIPDDGVADYPGFRPPETDKHAHHRGDSTGVDPY